MPSASNGASHGEPVAGYVTSWTTRVMINSSNGVPTWKAANIERWLALRQPTRLSRIWVSLSRLTERCASGLLPSWRISVPNVCSRAIWPCKRWATRRWPRRCFIRLARTNPRAAMNSTALISSAIAISYAPQHAPQGEAAQQLHHQRHEQQNAPGAVVPHGHQVRGIHRQEVADHRDRQGGEHIGRDPRFAGQRAQLAGSLLTFADHLDQVFQQLAGVAAITVVDLQTQREQAKLIALVEFGKVVGRFRQAHAQLHVAPDTAHGLLQRVFGNLDAAQHRVGQGSPGLEAANGVVEQLRQLFDHALDPPLITPGDVQAQ